MARATFRTITPTRLDPSVFDKAFEKAARDMEKGVKAAFVDATSGWKKKPVWRGYVRLGPDEIFISVGTADEIFKYVDQGTVAHIIRPVRAKMLHWTENGEDFFAKEVHHPGTKPRNITGEIQELWLGLMPEIFDQALQKAIQESGHMIHG